MRVSLDLYPGAASDISVEGEAPAMVLRVAGETPSLALEPAGTGSRLNLSPGRYLFDLELRTAGRVRPRLICTGPLGEAKVGLEQTTHFGWRAQAVFTSTITALTLNLDGLQGVFVIARCRIEAEAPDPRPSVFDACRQLARALYRKSPRALQRMITRAAARLRVGAHRREAAASHDAAALAGHIRVVAPTTDTADRAELEARRADFDARFAVARGLTDPGSRIDVGGSGSGGARVVAYYLPQFHRIAENDAWWGPGFTEWTNVSKAIPQFVGHHQPRLPGELGFYDLAASDTLRRQVDLARTGGISAFCFHYYWFAGRRLLEKPLDAFLADKSLDLGFTLCWANENWTRRWDGADDAVLIAQSHSAEDHARVFDDLARHLEDPRAIRIGGKPLVLVYRPAIIADARAMTDIWRECAVKRGWPGVFIAATEAFQFDDPRSLGFDALADFPPHGLSPARIDARLSWLNPSFRGVVFDYSEVAADAIAHLQKRRPQPFVRFPGVMPGWDNEARRPAAGTIFHGATPEAYARWLEAACEAAARTLPPGSRLVFVNAWNEWAEGAYLEPDRKWGRAFLDATAAVIGR